jgi:cob(I)alamin adenosyltransferase
LTAYREPISRKKQNLGYLCEDLERKITKLRDWNDEDDVESYRLDEANSLISEIAALDLGFELRLNDLQYCLGEMQIHLFDGSEHYILIDECITHIQDFLDW